MTLLIPLLLRLTSLFERGVAAEEPSDDTQVFVGEAPVITPEKE